jgi:hypothetical protein
MKTPQKKRHQMNICGEALRSPIDCSNDALMVQEGLRPAKLSIDRSVFHKTEGEKKALKREKTKYSPYRERLSVKRYPTFNNRLTIYLINTKKDKNFKTTVSFEIDESKIQDALYLYKGQVNKAFYNGRRIK